MPEEEPIVILYVGKTVHLNWNGWPGVPKWLDGDEATVLGFTKSRITVQPKSATRSYWVRWDQIDTRPRATRKEHADARGG